MSQGRREKLWRDLVTKVDGFLVPAAFGLLCIVAIVQVVTAIPSVRRHVDAVAGRFVPMPHDIIPTSVHDEEATVSLYAAPEGEHGDVKVMVNGEIVGSFVNPRVDVHVREGDTVAVENDGPGTVEVAADHNSPYLLLPAPGDTIDVDSGDTIAFPASRFYK